MTTICFVGLMNLPILSDGQYQGTTGGEELQHCLLAKELANRGYRVTMACLDLGQPARFTKYEITVFRMFRATRRRSFVKRVFNAASVFKTLRATDATLYYTSGRNWVTYFVGFYCFCFQRAHVIRIAHDNDVNNFPKLGLTYSLKRFLFGFIMRRAKEVLAQTPYQKESLMKNYSIGSSIARMLVEAHPSDADSLRDDRLILWVNNMRPFKRPELFLELAQQYPQYNFLMIGGALREYPDIFREIEFRASNIPNITFLGQVPYSEIQQYYNLARIFVNTSDSEGFPNSFLQSWAAGTPVLSFFDPDRLIEKFDLGISVKSFAEMSDALRVLLSNQDLWQNKSNNAVQFIRERFDRELVISEYLEAFL